MILGVLSRNETSTLVYIAAVSPCYAYAGDALGFADV